MERKIEAFIQQNQLFSEQDIILAAFSGGGDSTALIHLLLCAGYRVRAFHVNHAIRGAQADADEAFCRAFCAERGIPFICERRDVPARVKRTGESEEEAARAERYDAMRAYCLAHDEITCVATAHHADDLLETLLYRLLRGTGNRGMGGIAPRSRFLPRAEGHRAVTLVRPMLCVTREDILNYLSLHKLYYCTDDSNADLSYTRNRIRHALGDLGATVNSAYGDALIRFCDNARADEAYFDGIAQAFLREHEQTAPQGTMLPVRRLTELSVPVLRRTLMRWYRVFAAEKIAAAPWLQLGTGHVEAMCAFCRASSTQARRLALPHGVILIRYPDEVMLCRDQSLESDGYGGAELHSGCNRFPMGTAWLETDAQTMPKGAEAVEKRGNIYKLSTQVSLKFDTLKQGIFVHARDKIVPGTKFLHRGHAKTVKKLLADCGVPTYLRAALPVFTDGDGVPIWVPFCPAADAFAAKNGEKCVILRWECIDMCDSGAEFTDDKENE